MVKFCLVCFPFVKSNIPISTSYVYFINYFILFVNITCLCGFNGVIFVYTIRENKMKNLIKQLKRFLNDDFLIIYAIVILISGFAVCLITIVTNQ